MMPGARDPERLRGDYDEPDGPFGGLNVVTCSKPGCTNQETMDSLLTIPQSNRWLRHRGWFKEDGDWVCPRHGE